MTPSLRTTLYWFSWLHSMQRHWVCALSRRSDCYRWHRMSLRARLFFSLFSLLLFLLVFGIRNAWAQTEPTGTPTFEPWFPTRTPPPAVSLDCPEGTPNGWGTVTPPALWLAECITCIRQLTPTNTPEPSATPLPWMITSTPNGTLQATATPTVMATPTPGLALRLSGYVDYPVSNMSGTWQFIEREVTVSTVSEVSTYVVGMAAECIGCSLPNAFQSEIKIDIATSYSFPSSWARIGYWNGSEGKKCWSNSGTIEGVYLSSSTICSLPGYTAIGSVTPGMWGVQSGPMRFRTGVLAASGTVRVRWILFDRGLVQQPTPTPTRTPVVSYCSTVPGGVPERDYDDVLPVPLLGQAQCVINVPSFSGGTSGLSWLPGIGGLIENVDFPGLSVCFREVRFGEVKLFGLVISLDWLSAIMTGIVGIRIITRS